MTLLPVSRETLNTTVSKAIYPPPPKKDLHSFPLLTEILVGKESEKKECAY